MSTERMLLIALNEYNIPLLEEATSLHRLPHLAALLGHSHSELSCEDTVEHQGLDPWVQWASIHTGQPSRVHGLLRLGDVPALNHPQLWEVLSRNGVSSGVWGAMNASRGEAGNCRFFFPDPWSYSEHAHPPALNRMLRLPRYYSKNYLDVSFREILLGALSFAGYQLTDRTLPRLLGEAPRILQVCLQTRLQDYGLFLLFDLVSACHFIQQARKHQTSFNMIFLNSLAHAQHHHWNRESLAAGPLAHCLTLLDHVFALLLDEFGGDRILLVNGLTQYNVPPDDPRILYRQKNPARFLDAMGIVHTGVEQGMTNDAHLFFADRETLERAASILRDIKVEDSPLFHVEEQQNLQLFFQVALWRPLPDNASIRLREQTFPFFDHLEAVVQRTGAHVPRGDVLARGVELPPTLPNHELFHWILRSFDADPEAAATP